MYRGGGEGEEWGVLDLPLPFSSTCDKTGRDCTTWGINAEAREVTPVILGTGGRFSACIEKKALVLDRVFMRRGENNLPCLRHLE